MSGRLDAFFEFVRRGLIEPLGRLGNLSVAALRSLGIGLWYFRWRVVATAVPVLIVYGLYTHPPFDSVRRGEVLARTDGLDGSVNVYTSGTVLVLPGIHQVRRYSIRDQVYRPTESASATGSAPFQSVEGLSIGVDLTVRWTVDLARLFQMTKEFPDDISADLVAPAVQGIVYPTFARYSVREIFSQRRTEIKQELIVQLEPKFTAMGLVLREVDIGKVDLPADYRAGMEKLLAEELETEKIHFTLQLKEAQVKQQQLEAGGRQGAAANGRGGSGPRASHRSARAQEETMRHILPFKQKQIEQRQLEAEADKVSRIRTAEGAAEARRIEARGEADSRQKLADAEAYRLDLVGKANSGQMEREGVLVSRYPLLIQKTLADKLSDKVQVIIAPLPAAGKFIGSSLIGDQSSVNPVDDVAVTLTSKAGAPTPRRGSIPVILALAATLAIVVQDHAALRAAPRSSATELTRLWQGDVLEVRGEHAGYLKVYDYRRERGGYLRGDAARPFELSATAAPDLLAVLRFLRETPGSEALGISYGAAYLKVVPAQATTAEPFDAIAQMAERLADQASGSTDHLADFAPHLEVVEQFGIRMRSFERNGRMRVCYDGELFHRVLALPGAHPEVRAHALLGLTRPDCIDPDLSPVPRAALDTERSQLLDQVKDGELNAMTRSRLHARRAGVWAAVAFGQDRRGEPAGAAACSACTRGASRRASR